MWLNPILNRLIVLVMNIFIIIKLNNAFECGVRKVTINKLIVRGQQTSPGDWPWHAAIYNRRGPADEYVCGGSLISETFVLTERHCFVDENADIISSQQIYVRLGLHNLRHLTPKTLQQHNVIKIHTYLSDKRRNDIAILELATKAEFTDHVQPVCLNQEEFLTGQFGTTIGWGFDENYELSPILQSLKMPVIRASKCIEINDGVFRSVLDSTLFCAGYANGSNICNGDAGGGLHFERDGVWYIGGIASFTALANDGSLRCHITSYGVFTNVEYFLEWIRNVTGLPQPSKNGGLTEKVQTGQDLQLLPQDCGKYLVDKIFGDSTAALYEFPWIVRLMSKDGESVVFRGCHGSLINKRYVLTNANCAISAEYKPYQIDLGDYDQSKTIDCNVKNKNDCAPPVLKVGIESTVSHPRYNASSFWNNIALIRLDRDIQFDDHIQPLCLPVTEALRQQKIEQGIVAGWGRTKWFGKYPDILQKATVHVIDNAECKKKFGSRIYVGNDVICTGGNKTPNTCSRDFGIPLGYPSQYNDRIRLVQFGISAAVGCEIAPSSYTFVPNYVDWILANLKP